MEFHQDMLIHYINQSKNNQIREKVQQDKGKRS